MLGRMIALAANAHNGQYDKGGNPYILHPLAVMHILKTKDEELMCIAVGHDLLEDTDVTVDDLVKAGQTQRVIDGILAMTRGKNQSYNDYKEQVLSSMDAMLVKSADLRHNSDITRLKGVTKRDTERMERYQLFYTEIQEAIEAWEDFFEK